MAGKKSEKKQKDQIEEKEQVATKEEVAADVAAQAEQPSNAPKEKAAAKQKVHPKVELIKQALEESNSDVLLRIGGIQIIVSELVDVIDENLMVFKKHRGSVNPICVDASHVSFFYVL